MNVDEGLHPDIYKKFYDEIAKACKEHDGDLAGIGNQAIVSLERVRRSLLAADRLTSGEKSV